MAEWRAARTARSVWLASPTTHALRVGVSYPFLTACGVSRAYSIGRGFDEDVAGACAQCVAAIESGDVETKGPARRRASSRGRGRRIVEHREASPSRMEAPEIEVDG